MIGDSGRLLEVAGSTASCFGEARPLGEAAAVDRARAEDAGSSTGLDFWVIGFAAKETSLGSFGLGQRR